MTDPREELRERIAKALYGKAIGGTPRDWTPTGVVNQWSAEYLADAVLDALGLEVRGRWTTTADGKRLWFCGYTTEPVYRLAAPSGPQEGP